MSYYVAEPVGPAVHQRGGYFMGMGQELPALDFGTDAGGEVPTDSDVSSFSSWYSQYQAAWNDFLQMDATIQDHLARWANAAAAASAAGDTAAEDQATQRIAWLQTARDTRNQVQATIDKFSGAWDSFRSYVSAAGRWFGLGLVPLMLPFAIAAAIAGLAYVVTKIVELRNGLNYDTQLLQAVETKLLTPAAAAALSAAAHGGGAGGFSTTTLLLGGAVVVAGLAYFGQLGGRR
jgi:hypothetical protein